MFILISTISTISSVAEYVNVNRSTGGACKPLRTLTKVGKQPNDTRVLFLLSRAGGVEKESREGNLS